MSYPPPPEQPDNSGDTQPPPPPPSPYGSAPPPPPPAYGSPPPPGYGYPAGGGYAVPVGNQKALWALILGILGLLCCGLASIAALILGMQAKSEIRASGGMQTGEGQAQAGFILGIIGCALWAVGLVAYAGLAVIGTSGGL